MKYIVKIVRNFYNNKAVREKKQIEELYFHNSLDAALIAYNSTIIGERITSELNSFIGSTNFYVLLTANIDGETITLESTFIHNGEVMQ